MSSIQFVVFKNLVAVGIRAKVFVYEERGTLEGTGRQLFISLQTCLSCRVLPTLSCLTGYMYSGGVLGFSLYGAKPF